MIGQTWYPDNAKWYFNLQILLDYPAHGYTKYDVVKDTMISSETAKLIIGKSYSFNNGAVISIDTFLLREENSKVYKWNGSSFNMMYDFTLSKGDTLDLEVVNLDCDSISPIIIDSIGQIKRNGISLDVQYVSYIEYWPDENPFKINDQIIERIGRIREFIYSPICAINSVSWANLRLRCYEDNDFFYQSNWWTDQYPNAPCDSLIDGSTEIDLIHTDNQITLYPNPCRDKLNLQYTVSLIKGVNIYDSFGQIVSAYQVNDNELRLDVGCLELGVYFIEIITDELTDTRVLIKQ